MKAFRYFVGGALASVAVLSLQAQQTTNTNCTMIGNNLNCTSNTTDYAAQQQRSYQQGQQIGNALGTGLALAMQSHAHEKWVKKYCAGHPGEGWRWYRKSDGQDISTGTCPTLGQKANVAANEFMARHKDYVQCDENSSAIVSYLQSHNLNPSERKSYEQAFRDLKKSNQLKLYAN